MIISSSVGFFLFPPCSYSLRTSPKPVVVQKLPSFASLASEASNPVFLIASVALSRRKEHMQHCVIHPEEMSKLSKLKAQITGVKGIMMDNIEKVLVNKTDDLQFQADIFQRQGRQLRRKMWFQNIQMKLMINMAMVVIILLFWLNSRAGGK